MGEWLVQPSLNRLSRNGDEVRVEPKVMQVLDALAETPGEVVTREQLVARVWAGVFVTDDVLHRAIRELRRVFGDNTASPSYIETIRKRGYRLIAPVRRGGPADPAAVNPALLKGDPVETPLPVQRYGFIATLSVTLAVVLGAVVYVLASRPAPAESTTSSVRFVAMTSGPFNEVDPAISPDGTRLAFAMRQEGADATPADLYLTEAPGRTPSQLTAHPADDRYPAWSHDASQLAFVRVDGGKCDIMIMALADKRERRVTACGNPEEPRVSWTKDGDWLIESFAPGPDPIRGWQIARVSTTTGVRETLTLPTPGTLGDYNPSVSPDGSRIAFVRGINGATSDLHVVSVSGGAPTRVTWDNQDLVGVDWSADGQSLIYATDRAGGYTIWRVGVDGGDPHLVVGGAAKLKHPSVARATGRVTYESWAYEINLWESPIVDRLDLEGEPASTIRPTVQTSDQWNHSPDLSPDETQIAFVSTRSGGAEIWIANRDGSRARQLSTFGRASMRVPRWSPDGKSILISAAVNGQPDLYTFDAASGAMTRLTNDHEDEVAPYWSPDGASILFTRLEQPGIFTMPVDGGPARLRVPGVRAAETLNWRATPSGIYFVGVTSDQIVVRRAPLSGGAGVDVSWLGNYSWPGFAVSKDGKVIYAHWDRREANIMGMDQ